MKSREQWAAEQEEYLQAYDEVREELLKIPGVDEVGVGIKETGSSLTDEVAFRVYVAEKIPESDLPPEHVVPSTIRGFRTDVIKRRDRVDVIGFDDEDDSKNYSTKVGGIYIGSENGGGTGTLGCFCRLTSDNSVVFLSNHHVLFSGTAVVGTKVGQPEHERSCCCTCNEIGEIVDGEPKPLDCAIAKLNSDVPFFSKIRQIKRNDGTLELNGFITGSGAAVLNDEVWKIGARTGLTRGNISDLVPNLEIQPRAPFTRVANFGDSGSVVVRLRDGEVVGLLKSIDAATEALAYATPIQSVLTRLKIDIIPTDETRWWEYDVVEVDEDRLDLVTNGTRESAYAAFAERLQASEAGQKLLRLIGTHRRECLALVNHRRAVTVTWHRNKGPTFLAALARSAKEPSYRIPTQVEGIDRERAAIRIREAFEAHGSEALRADLRAYSGPLIEALIRCDTVDDLAQTWEEITLSAPAEQTG